MRVAKGHEANLKNTEKCKKVVDGSTQNAWDSFHSILKADHNAYYNLQNLMSRDNLVEIAYILTDFLSIIYNRNI
jgi:hypothetical protein